MRVYDKSRAPRRHLSRYRDVEDRGALIRARLLAFATLITGLAYLAWLLFALNQAPPVDRRGVLRR
jgi:hypothetical protein